MVMSMASSDTAASAVVAQRLTAREALKLIVALFKLRVVSLLLFAAVGGAFLGARGVPSIGALLAILITGTLAAGGASAINQYLERSEDQLMRRTSRRPLASGLVQRPVAVLWVAIAMIAVAVLAVLPFNPPMALYLGLGAAIYVGVYTVWLKPRSVLNIVIGGAAGSCAVMTGGAAVGAASNPGVIALALLLFLWTPAHFWALAMFYEEDYAKAGVPMLPVRANPANSAWWIFVHALSTSLAALALAVSPALGWPYLIPTGMIAVALIVGSVRLIRTPERKQAIKLFVTSNLFLALVLLSIILVTVGHQLFA
jgi:protoheme IX farnesyltransferase